MIVVFLIVLIMALIIANMLVSIAKPHNNTQSTEMTTYGGEAQIPEVIEKISDIHENTSIIQGSLAATNKKIELLANRVSTLEKVTMTLTSQELKYADALRAKEKAEDYHAKKQSLSAQVITAKK